MALLDSDREILPLALRHNKGYHVATRWYLRDWEPMSLQWAYHQLLVPSTTFLAGIAYGKTANATASNTIDCISIPYFKALNTSLTAKQAELPFDMLMGWIEGNDRLEHLIEDIRLRPWPLIKFKNFSEYEFRTSGTDARFIRGTEYDRITFDEAGLDLQGDIVKILRGRLRGKRPNGTKRMARLDVITSPTDALWLRERFDRGLKGHERYDPLYVSLRARTRENIHLTPQQVAAMEAEYTDDWIRVEMDAEFPDFGLSMFPRSHIGACTKQELNDSAYIALNPEDNSPPKKDWVVEEHPRHGVIRWEMPYNPRDWYVMAGDPGIDNPPKRNSGAVGVMNQDGVLVYFHWIGGQGSYMPFLNSYKYAIRKYRPQLKLLDTTGTQKMMQELAFENLDIETDGFNFQRDKDGALNALSLMITGHSMSWPMIKGLIRQLSTYTREDDKKIAQDIVMMLAMLAFGMRWAPSDPIEEVVSHATASKVIVPRNLRTTSRRRRR